jgi:hypothetical protein
VSIVSVGRSVPCAALVCCALACVAEVPGFANRSIANEIANEAPSAAFEAFLDRLMGAESGGRSSAKNPRSTAVGAFQFIKSTFLGVVRTHFAAEVVGLTDAQILALRKDAAFSRRAAAAFSRDNIDQLKQKGVDPTFARLRLAFLLGAHDAARLIQAKPLTPVGEILSPAIIIANPFMAKMTVADLLAKASSDVEGQSREHLAQGFAHSPTTHVTSARPAVRRVKLQITCNGKPVACRRFYASRARKAAGSRMHHGKA